MANGVVRKNRRETTQARAERQDAEAARRAFERADRWARGLSDTGMVYGDEEPVMLNKLSAEAEQ